MIKKNNGGVWVQYMTVYFEVIYQYFYIISYLSFP